MFNQSTCNYDTALVLRRTISHPCRLQVAYLLDSAVESDQQLSDLSSRPDGLLILLNSPDVLHKVRLSALIHLNNNELKTFAFEK